MLLGIDTGGTFTDFVLSDGNGVRFAKVLSTPEDPAHAILEGIAQLGVDPHALQIVHGSTVATNAILERKGVRTLFVTNAGLEDLLLIGRQTRPALYKLCPKPKQAWLSRSDCAAVHGRIDAEGMEIEPLDEGDVEAIAHLAKNYESVAICLLFSFLNPAHERRLVQALKDGPFVSASHEILPEYREYERAATTFLNAYIGPKVSRYLSRLSAEIQPKRLFITHSAGGVMAADEAGAQAVRLVLSGPAGGLMAARHCAEELGEKRIITFDMGGTSTDVALMDEDFKITTEGSIAGLPIAVPMLDIHTIGAGGGSIAWRDLGGLLRVGPQSAGADPGPACYGKGGDKPTVTDAHLLLGHLPQGLKLAGNVPLHKPLAEKAFHPLAQAFAMGVLETAKAVLRVAEENMTGALRVVSIERGHDPRRFTLVCFGGAGGLHACSLAESLGIKKIIWPRASGAFSALGMLVGRRQCDLSRSKRIPLDERHASREIEAIFSELEAEAQRRMQGLCLTYRRFGDLRYRGQGFHLILPYQHDPQTWREAFEQEHMRAYGHTLHAPVEVMTLRLTAIAETTPWSLPPMPKALDEAQPHAWSEVYGLGSVPVFSRASLSHGHRLDGPAIIVDDISTFLLHPKWRLEINEQGHAVGLYGEG